MRFVKIKDLNKAEDIKNLYEKTFPPRERVDFKQFFSGVFQGFELYGLYQQGKLIGMAHLNNTENFVHLNYLAVDKEYQSQGCGSYIISKIKHKFNNKPIVVDVEDVNENATDIETRIRRINFYKRNGFNFGKYVFDWEGFFMVYMTYKNIDSEEFMIYIQQIFPTITNVRERKV